MSSADRSANAMFWHPFRNDFLPVLLTAVIYFVFAMIGLQLATINANASPVWPATGFTLYVVWRHGAKHAIGVLLGGFCATLTTPTPLAGVIGIAISNGLEGLAAAWIFRHLVKPRGEYGELLYPITLVFACFLSAVVGATSGVLSMCLTSTIPWSVFTHSWVTWWSGDGIGGLFILPLLEAMRAAVHDKLPLREWARSVLIGVLVALLTGVMINTSSGIWFLCFALPLILALAIFTSNLSAQLALTTIAAVSILYTAEGFGPFHWSTINTNLINLQILLASLAIASLFSCTFLKMPAPYKPLSVMMAGALCGSFAMWLFIQSENQRDDERAAKLMEEDTTLLENRITEYISNLKSAASFWKTHESEGIPLSRKAWADFAEDLALLERLPGIKALAIARRLSSTEAPAFIKAHRATFPDFAIKPLIGAKLNPDATEHYLVTHAEPYHDNTFALGLDLTSEPVRKLAADWSSDHREPRISGKINLAEAGARDRSSDGFVIYYPVFLKERQLGWVYSPFRIQDFFLGLRRSTKDEIGWSIAFAARPDEPIFRTPTAEMDESTTLRKTIVFLSNTPFEITWFKLKGFVSSHDSTAAWVTAAIALMSIAVSAMIANLQAVKVQAETLAERISHDLEKHRLAIFHSSKMSSLGHMASGIAHEINNPLSIITLNAEMLKRDLAHQHTLGNLNPNTSSRQLERIEKIESTVSRISSIIRGLQNFSRSGDSLPKRLCALSTIVTTVLDFCSQKFKHHNIELRLSPCPAVEVAVVQIQIEQVLVNLLSNSFDAVVDLKERWVAITYEVTSEAVSILVTDSGTGLPAHVASRITEPFFTTKPVGQGTGLGLSICKGIMESHGGELHYDRESANTRFRIVIPNPSIIQTPVAITPDAISPSEKTRVTHIKQSS